MSLLTISTVFLGIFLALVPSVRLVEVGEDNAIVPDGIEWFNSLFYLPTEVRVRKEYRMLSDEERNEFHTAFVMMKNDTSVKPNKYDLFVSLHARRSSRNSAHKGPGFLPWHRIYLLLMENAMREQIPNVTIPYWDSSMDAILKIPRLSCLWNEDFIGNGDGYVVEGVFKSWTTVTSNLYRAVGNQEGPLADRNISILFEYPTIGDISLPRLPYKNREALLEDTHNRVHRWVGGEMFNIETAGQDPVFYIFHAFVDRLYEDFRDHQRAKGIDPETDWDQYYGQVRHHPYSPMGLGNLMAIDGANEIFAENIHYAPRPTCSRQETDCKSPYLYCNVIVEKCVPWTIRQYKNIKRNAEAKFLPFAVEAKIATKYQITAGFEELYRPSTTTPETTTTKSTTTGVTTPIRSIGHDHTHSHEESEESFEADDDTHGMEDHKHVHVHHTSAVVDVIPTWREYTLLMIFALLLAIRIVMCTCSKCISESRKRRKGNCTKYTMDGIVNQNYQTEDEAKIHESDGFNNRSDIYTVTVTCNDSSTIGSSTYVRFSRYIIGDKSKDNKNKRKSIELLRVDNMGNSAESNYDIVENHIEKIRALEHKAMDQEDTGNGIYENSNQALENTSKDNCNENEYVNAVRNSIASNDYMDMTYATKTDEEKLDKSSDMFEKESEVGELHGETDDEERLNSIENENYELPIATTVNSFAFLDDYDNVYFLRDTSQSDDGKETGDSIKEIASIDNREENSEDEKYVNVVEHM